MKYDATTSEQLAWRIRWHAARSLMNNSFPASKDYHMSQWAMWEERVKNGHNAEQKWIEKRYEELKDCPDVPDDLFSDDYSQTVSLTNSMYATLVVSIWSEMESFLKRLVFAIYRTTGKSQKIHYRFDKIKEVIKSGIRIQLERCASYSTVNAVRELNNSFKHSNGFCDSKSYEQIKKSPFARKVLPDRRKRDTRKHGKKVMVEYTKLPIRDILNACNEFCSVLLDRVENKLNKQPLRGGKGGIEL